MIRIKDLTSKPKCPRCGSSDIGMLKVDEEKTQILMEKKGQKLTKAEEKLLSQALQTAESISKYGKAAAVALSARRVKSSDVQSIFEKEPALSDRFYELVIEAERKTMRKRFR